MKRLTRVLPMLVILATAPLLMAPGECPCPDCEPQVQSLSVRAHGEGCQVELLVINKGSSALGGVWVDLFVNQDQAPGRDDRADWSRWVPRLEANESRLVTMSLDEAPAGLRVVDVRLDSPFATSSPVTITSFERSPSGGFTRSAAKQTRTGE